MTADEYNRAQIAQGRVTGELLDLLLSAIYPEPVTSIAAAVSEFQGRHNLVVDGKLGPATRAALGAPPQRAHRVFVVDPGHTHPGPAVAVPPDQRDDTLWGIGWAGPLERIPRDRTEIYKVFGDPGPVAKPNKKWRRANIITVRDLPGVPTKWHFQVHRLAEPYMREGLRRASVVSGYQIERAASWVHRHIRHDAARPLSLHSFGIAIDVDSHRNGAKTFQRGEAPVPWSPAWMKIWPHGVDEGFVDAMESVGFTWGGAWGRSGGPVRERVARASFIDPMHFELRDRR